MSSKLFQTNLTFWKLTYRLGAVFCIVPWFDMETAQLKRPILSKVYSIIYMASVIGTLVKSQFNEKSYSVQNNIEDVLYTTNIIVLIITVIVLTLGSNFIMHQEWTQFLSRMAEFREDMSTMDKYFTTYFLQFIIGHLAFFAAITHSFMIWSEELRYGNKYLFFLTLFVPEYFCLVSTMVVSPMALVIHKYYNALNKMLETNVKTYQTGDGIGCPEEKLVAHLVKVGRAYRRIYEVTQNYNNIFGSTIMLMLCHSIIQMLRCVNLMIVAKLRSEFSFHQYLGIFFWALISMAENSLVIITCDRAAAAGAKTDKLCYKLQENPKNSRKCNEELLRLAHIAKIHQPHFTAANFFTIDKRTLLGLVNIVATYIIIIIQCNKM